MGTIVQDAVEALRSELGADYSVTFSNTGGGCFAILVAPVATGELGPHILITDGQDVFTEGDWDSDYAVSGFTAYLHTADDAVEPVEVFADYALWVGDKYDDDDYSDPAEYDDWARTVEGRTEAVKGFIPALVAAVRGTFGK